MFSRPHCHHSALLAAFGAASVVASGAAFAACTGPGAPSDTQTKCLTAVQIPGNPLRSYDISFVNPHRAEYYLADRSNAGIDIIECADLDRAIEVAAKHPVARFGTIEVRPFWQE